jgi:methylenetetrahydrofolate reductase (NADPH)
LGTFNQAIQGGRFAISAELTLNRASTVADIHRQADLLRGLVDGVQVTDNPLAWVNMSSVAAAALLLREDIDPVPILTCRDRNRNGLHSDLLGLRALGVDSVLLMRGRRVGRNHQLTASTVFDMTGRDLIAMAAAMNEDETLAKAPPFLIGAGARVYRARAGWQAESLREKASAGARFLQTQICYNVDLVGHYLQRLVAARMTWNYAVIVSLTPLNTAELATWVKQNLSDSKIPKSVIERLEKAKDPRAEGIAICAETMQALAEIPGVSGVNLVSTGDPELLAEAIRASGLR